MAVKKPLQTLHVLLLKQTLSDPDDALRNKASLERFDVSGGLNFSGALFLAKTSQAVPPWLKFVQAGVVGSIPALKNRTNSAVLLIKKGGRFFALTFGHGRFLLKPEVIAEDFGLRVALNGLKADSLRSMDSLLIEERTVHVRRQTSKASAIDAFGIDVGKDILRAITGTPKSETGLHALAGAEGTVALTARVAFGELGDACGNLRKIYQQDSYRDAFGWVDNIRHVRRADEREALNARLVVALKGDPGAAYLSVPETIDWMDCGGFAIPRDDDQSHEPNLAKYLAALPTGADLSLERRKRDRLSMQRVSAPDAALEWPIFRCLNFETHYKGRRYILSAGEWYRIADGLADEVGQEVSTIPTCQRAFPKVLRVGAGVEREGDYNVRAAGADPSLSLLDRRVVRCRGAATAIEACDLLSDSGQLIHVKPRGSSSVLSHLFWQARVSAEALLADGQFREEVRSQLATQNPLWIHRFPDARPDPSGIEIVFALLGCDESNPASGLPFFSQVTLSRTSRYLRSAGFKISQIGVPIEP